MMVCSQSGVIDIISVCYLIITNIGTRAISVYIVKGNPSIHREL